MAELYNIIGKGLNDIDNILVCVEEKHNEFLSLIEGVKASMKRDVLSAYANNQLLIDDVKKCGEKKIKEVSQESATAISSFINYNMTAFQNECGDVVASDSDSKTFKLYQAAKHTLIYHLPTIFPQNDVLTDAIHTLAVESPKAADHFIMSKVKYSTYVLNCEPKTELTGKISSNWGKIFDLQGNVNSLENTEDRIEKIPCAKAVNDALVKYGKALNDFISNFGDTIKLRVQLGNDKCLKFTQDLETLVKLEDEDMLFREDPNEQIKNCQDLLELKDPDDNTCPYSDIKIVGLQSIEQTTITEIEQKCGIQLAGESTDLV